MAAHIARTYDLLPMPTGVLALGLVLNGQAGAALALLEDSELEHGELVELLQEELLDTELEALEETLGELAALTWADGSSEDSARP
jgi:hypothetical protein